MTRRDWDLLDKQFHWLVPTSNNNGIVLLTIVGIFLGGITLSGTLSVHQSKANRPAGGSSVYQVQ